MLHRKILSLSVALLLSLPAVAAPESLSGLQKQLNQGMEALLKTQTQRQSIGFEATWTQTSAGTYQLKVPAHIERDTYLNVTLSFEHKRPVLSGQVLSAAERDLLVQAVTQTLGAPARVSLEVFPFQGVEPPFAVTVSPSSDLYVKPQPVAGENLATQVRLGTPLQILAYSSDRKLARVRVADDGYIAWIQRKDLREGSASWYQQWLEQRQVLVMKNLTQPANLPFGTRLRLLAAQDKVVQAQLPDGKNLNLNRSDVLLNPPQSLPAAEQILTTARQYLPQGPQGGGAYLWGGSLGKRLDCSGFVQTVFRVNGVYLPRDADQQKGFTQGVGASLTQLSELQPGDLVFFSGNGKYPTHVGLYLGGNQFIHASAKGQYDGVKINTLKGGGDYDKYLQKIYFGGGRVTRSL